MEKIIIVDDQDNAVGYEEKLKTHQLGLMHRAFSVLIMNNKREMLIQKRNKDKYHSGGLWANACCSHPRAGEHLDSSIHRRLQEEMGFDCELYKIGHLTYRVEFDNGLIENEYDHVFFGKYDNDPVPDPQEAEDWRWIALDDLYAEVGSEPQNFAFWFKEILEKFGFKSLYNNLKK